MSGSIRIEDMPSLGAVGDGSRFVAELAGTGTYTGAALRDFILSGGSIASLTVGALTVSGAASIAGTLTTGVLNNSGGINSSGAVSGNGVYANYPSNTFGLAQLAGSNVLNWAANWYDSWNQSTGDRAWVGDPATTLMSLSGAAGNLVVRGSATVQGAGGLVGQRLTLNGGGANWSMFVDGSGNQVQNHTANHYEQWNVADGRRSWVNASVETMSLSPTGLLTVSGAMTTPAFWVAGTSSTFGMTMGGSGRIMQFAANHYWDYNPGTGALQYATDVGALWAMTPGSLFAANQVGPVGGVGAYVNTSDRRTKSNITPTDKGLEQILQLVPVSFTRTNPAANSGEEIGFIAQDVQSVIPEAVWTPAAGDTRHGEEPLMGLTAETITALNVNAVKELHQLIQDLTARVQELESRPGPPSTPASTSPETF